MLWRSRWFPALIGVLLLTGCAVPVPTPSLPTSPPPVAGAAAIPSGALLSITASGTIAGDSLFGCLASLLIDPGSGVVDRIASWDDARFAVERPGTGTRTRCVVGAPAIGGPANLAPGRYRLAGVASIVSDVASPGFSQMPILGSTARCELDLLVLPETTAIAIHVTFRDGPCTIDVTTS
jgi:hypothetical protein